MDMAAKRDAMEVAVVDGRARGTVVTGWKCMSGCASIYI